MNEIFLKLDPVWNGFVAWAGGILGHVVEISLFDISIAAPVWMPVLAVMTSLYLITEQRPTSGTDESTGLVSGRTGAAQLFRLIHALFRFVSLVATLPIHIVVSTALFLVHTFHRPFEVLKQWLGITSNHAFEGMFSFSEESARPVKAKKPASDGTPEKSTRTKASKKMKKQNQPIETVQLIEHSKSGEKVIEGEVLH